MFLLIIFLLGAVLISFTCSLMESVLLSISQTFAKINENSPQKGIRKICHQKQNIDKPLAAILSINTIANTIGAAGVGAQATAVFGQEYFGYASGVLTILILICSEIIPKNIGSNYAEKLAGLVGHLISFFMIISYPFIILTSLITGIIKNKNANPTTSREEISALASIGTKEGIFIEKENVIIQNLIKLKTIKVSSVMTPRVVVCLADQEMSLDEFLNNKDYLRFSRIPVYSQTEENITGYVFRQQIMEALALDRNQLKLKDLKREIIFAPNTKPLFSMWDDLLRKKEQIAVIVDEYGGVDGVITQEDIIETLLGFEILDEKDTVADMQAYAREKWEKKKNLKKS